MTSRGALVNRVWNCAPVLRDDGAGCGAYVAQIATHQPGSRWWHWKGGNARASGRAGAGARAGARRSYARVRAVRGAIWAPTGVQRTRSGKAEVGV